MCGIAGGIHYKPSPDEAAQVLRALRHRGPDGSGIWMGEGLWLANTRLAIQDLWAGDQPMHTPDKTYTIVYNGELYNAPELRRLLELEGVIFRTRCDTEVLLHAYATWGADCLNRLEGDFAFAIWNSVRQELFLARDPMGVKPLYLYNDGKQLLFASEIKALLRLRGLDYSLAPEVFRDYLLYLYSPSEQTPFRFIRKLLPAHFVRTSILDKDWKPKRYFQIQFNVDQTKTDREWQDALERTLANTVANQLHSDAPIGLMLSGGLDSSLIAALAKKSSPDLPLTAFTIDSGRAMAAEGFKDDLIYARAMAAHLKMPLQEVRGQLAPTDNWIDKLVWDLDEPQADPAAWYTGAIASAAQAQGIKVLLSGTGGDDVFSGYRRHQALRFYKASRFLPKGLSALPVALQRFFPAHAAGLRRLEKALSSAGLGETHAMIHSHFWAPPEEISRLLLPVHRPTKTAYAGAERLLGELEANADLLQQALFLEQRMFLPHHNLAYMDKMGMAHSVEIRVPFADRQLVSLAATMPSAIKMKGSKTKAVLRAVSRPYVPEEIIQRGKTGFGAPLRQWMRGDLAPVTRARLLDDSFYSYGIFNRTAVEALIVDNKRGRRDGAYTLFSLLCIESWLRQFA